MKANPEDMILISDLDEIPNLEKNDLKNIKKNEKFWSCKRWGVFSREFGI